MGGLDRHRVEATRIAHRAGARVAVELDWDALEPGVVVRFAPRGRSAPSSDVLAVWEQSVVHGVRYALAVARALPCGVLVSELCGDPEYTRPTVIAAAAAQAVWEALEIEPPAEVMARLQALVVESRERGPLWLADFEGP